MNKFEFYNEFKKLCEYFYSKIYDDERITAIYYSKVKHTTLENFKSKCDNMISSFKFMPKAADFDIPKNKYSNWEHREYSPEFLEGFYDNLEEEIDR